MQIRKPVRRNGAPMDVEMLEGRTLFSITTTTTCIKEPGPTDTQITTATNPAGHEAVGQTSTTQVENNQC